jgi:hypothetical protein
LLHGPPSHSEAVIAGPILYIYILSFISCLTLSTKEFGVISLVTQFGVISLVTQFGLLSLVTEFGLLSLVTEFGLFSPVGVEEPGMLRFDPTA